MLSAPCQKNHRLHFFEKVAPYYNFLLDLLTFGGYTKFLRKAVKILAPKNGEKILDLCSGTGRVVSWISQAVGEEGEGVGMDIAKSMIDVARERYRGFSNVKFQQRDVTQSWEYQNYFDGIFTSFSLHEIPEKYRLGVLEKCYQALKERGRMVIADFNPEISGTRKTLLTRFFKLFERENLNFLLFDQNEILKKVGFGTVRTFPILGGVIQIIFASKS